METQIIIPHSLGQALVDYLRTRPWGEVDALIRGLAQAREARVVPHDEPTPRPAAVPSRRAPVEEPAPTGG